MSIHTILKRGFHSVALLLIAVAAYFQAKGVGQLLGVALMKPAERHSTLPERDTTSAASSFAVKDGQPIRDRNPFDSTPPPVDKSETPTVDASDPLSWPACDDVRVLIVTQSSDPWWSLATLQTPAEPRPRLRRVGDGIAGKQVAFIGYNPKHQAPSVWLEGSGALCQTTMFRPTTPAPMTAAASPPAPATPTVAAADLPRHQAAIMSQIRVLPEQKDGKVIGLRLFGIRPSSVLASLGLRNGDRLETINGFELASPEKTLQAYAQLRLASHLHVQLTRVGKPLELDLNII